MHSMCDAGITCDGAPNAQVICFHAAVSPTCMLPTQDRQGDA